MLRRAARTVQRHATHMKQKSLESIVAERKRLVARVAEIDASLAEKGIDIAVKIRRSRPQRAAILASLDAGPKGAKDIARVTGQRVHAVAQMLHLMLKEGVLERAGRGVYTLAKRSVAA